MDKLPHPQRLVCALLLLPAVCPGLACPTLAAAQADNTNDPLWADRLSYGDQGLQYEDARGNNFLWFGVRAQTRWTGSWIVADELPGAPIDEGDDLAVNRARLKLGGHLFRPGFKVYSEYDLVGDRLIDLRATYRFREELGIRFGQWKSEFNRERVDSSGSQQFVERSIATPWFTIDRQQGIVASGRLASGTRTDTSYWFGWLTGAGRGGNAADAEGLWLGRAQWNAHGRLLGFSQSATGRPPEPTSSIAIAAVTGKSGFTAFSGSGGGQLPGFEDGASDRYRIEQLMVETAYQHRGFSWQQELHWKSIDDRVAGTTTRLIGGYAQAGMLFSEVFDGFPRPLEFAVRAAVVDPEQGASTTVEDEVTIAANWFINGHRNKLTLDYSLVARQTVDETDRSGRVRLQWDWQF